MTDPFESKAEYIRRMADDGGGDLASPAEVEAHITTSMSQMGPVHTDPATIPTSATIRPAGSFTDANDLHQYLERGGLVATDNNGADIIAIGFVHILQWYDDILMEDVFTVYIDEDTNPT